MGRAFEVRKASMAKTAGAKAKVYSQFGKEIYLAAKAGGTDPDANLSLRRLIDKAKKAQVPGDVIKRAIDKVSSGTGENYESFRYEGYGPVGSTVIVEGLTDNVNRTLSQIRPPFNRTKSTIGAQNSVSFAYDHISVLSVKGMDEEAILDACLMADVEIKDIESEDGETIVTGEPQDLYKIKTAIEEANSAATFETEEITWVAQETIELSGDDMEQFTRLITGLEEVDDVNQVYHNVANYEG